MAAVTLLLLLLSLASAQRGAAEPSVPKWRSVHERLSSERDRMVGDLEQAHGALLARARQASNEELIDQLTSEPPRAREHGYRVLPVIVDSPPRRSIEPRRRSYSLEELRRAYRHDFRAARLLARRAPQETEAQLAAGVDEFLRLRDRMSNLEDHLDYHARWQVAVVEYPAWFERRNRLVDRASAVVELIDRGGARAEVDALRRDLVRDLAPFRPVPGLAIERPEGGGLRLPVVVATDIEDASFLDRAREAIEDEYSNSAAARAAGLSIRLAWRRIPPARLYPDAAPGRGSVIDFDDHLQRFPVGSLVLTTGAESTHAFSGRAVLLGAAPLARRTLAHEFGHLLGFDDAYLRGFEGDPRSPFGAVLVEWVGLADDLMGNPGGGEVTRDMVETLIEAYDSPAAD